MEVALNVMVPVAVNTPPVLIVREAPVPLLLTEIEVTEGTLVEITGYLAKLPGIRTDTPDGTPEGLQLELVAQSVLVEPVHVFCPKAEFIKNKLTIIKATANATDLPRTVLRKEISAFSFLAVERTWFAVLCFIFLIG